MTMKRGIFLFSITTILLTGGFALLFYFLHWDFLSPALMFIPLITSFVTQKFILKKPILGANGLGFRLGKKRFLFLASLLSLIFIVVIYSISFLVHPKLFSMEAFKEAVQNLATYNKDFSLMTNVILAVSIQILVAPLLNIFIFIGEEVGWRGFLYPNLVHLYGKSGLLIGGFIWGIWHTPMIYLYDLNFGKHHHLGLLFMIAFCILAGIILQFMYVKSNSIYAVSLMHGMMNISAGLIFLFTVKEEYRYFIDGGTGLTGLTILFVIAVICYRKFPIENLERNNLKQLRK